MINEWWSWALFINGAFGLWLALNKPRIGSWYNIVGQTGWLTYGIVTQQWGFVAQAIVNGGVFLHLAHKTFREEKGNDKTAQT